MRPKDPRKSDSQVNRKKAEGIAEYEARRRKAKDREWLKGPDPFDGYQPRSPHSGSYSPPKRKPVDMPKVPPGGKRKPKTGWV